jgi:hypothetical protein
MKKAFILLLFLLIPFTKCLAGITVLDGLSHEYTVNQGSRIEGKITLRNSGVEPQQVRVYQTDYLFFATGDNIFGEPGSIPRSNAKWISFSPSRLTILPNETTFVYYQIQVPEKTDLPGSYWSMLMVEPFEEKTPETIRKGLGVQTVIRYGIQIVTDVGMKPEPKIRFLDKKLITENEKRIFQIDIENTGNTWLSPSVLVELYDQKGKNTGRFESGKLRIYPGCSVRHQVDFTEVPKGLHRVLVVADNKDGFAVGAQYDLEVR